MSDKVKDVIDNVLDDFNELDVYLETQIRTTLKEIINKLFNIHSYQEDPIRIFYMINIVVDRYVQNFLSYYQDMATETLKDYGVIGDLSDMTKRKEK